MCIEPGLMDVQATGKTDHNSLEVIDNTIEPVELATETPLTIDTVDTTGVNADNIIPDTKITIVG